MTNEEKAVIEAAKAWNALPVGDDEVALGTLSEAVFALEKAPAPTRQFWLSYVIDAADGIGHGAGSASVRGPVTAGVLEAWKQGLEALPANRARHARIVIQAWTELEA